MLVSSNEEHSMMGSDWLRVALLLSEISRSMAWEKNKAMSFKRKRSILSVRNKNEDADDIVFQMICKSVVSRLNVIFLIESVLLNFAPQ